MAETQTAEHPWVVVMHRKLRERGFVGDELEAEVNRMMNRFPFLRGKIAAEAEAIHRAIRQGKP